MLLLPSCSHAHLDEMDCKLVQKGMKLEETAPW